MSTQPKLIRFRALRLARQLEACGWDGAAPQLIADAAVELRLLHAETQRCRNVCDATAEGWRTDAEEWKVERDALLADAARYRWLRRNELMAKIQYMTPPTPEGIDAAIDARLKEGKP